MFNIVLGGFSALVGWAVNHVYQGMRELTHADRDLVSKVNSIEVLVAGTYVTRAEFENKISAMFNKLDRIEGKLDDKIMNISGGKHD